MSSGAMLVDRLFAAAESFAENAWRSLMSHPHEVRNCNCGASIFLAPTKAGKKVPLCERPDPLGNIYLNDQHEAVYVSQNNPAPSGSALYRSHFSDCPFAEQYRSKK